MMYPFKKEVTRTSSVVIVHLLLRSLVALASFFGSRVSGQHDLMPYPEGSMESMYPVVYLDPNERISLRT